MIRWIVCSHGGGGASGRYCVSAWAAIAIDRVDAPHDHQIVQYVQQNQQIDAYVKAIRSASRSPETALKAS